MLASLGGWWKLRSSEMSQVLVVGPGILNKQNHCPSTLRFPFQPLFLLSSSYSQHSPGSGF